jgi:hypothetical protein
VLLSSLLLFADWFRVTDDLRFTLSFKGKLYFGIGALGGMAEGKLTLSGAALIILNSFLPDIFGITFSLPDIALSYFSSGMGLVGNLSSHRCKVLTSDYYSSLGF